MQATVRTFDPGSRSGSVLTDEGIELAFDARAFAAGGIRLLRPGQRVRVAMQDPAEHVAGAAGVHALTIVTLAAPEVP